MPNAIIRPISSFGIMPAPGADSAPERQVAGEREHDDAEDDERRARDVIGAESHAAFPLHVAHTAACV